MSVDVEVRVAQEGDGPGIANVHLNSWQESYSGLIPDDFLAQMPLTFERRMKMWSRLILDRPDGEQFWIARDDEHGIVGFAAVCPPRDKEFEGHGELGAIYLLNPYKGRGVGYRLISEAFSFLRASGYDKAYCWVLDKNPTISFYERTGCIVTNMEKVDDRGNIKLIEKACVWDSLVGFGAQYEI